MLEAALIASRLLHYTASIVLFGASLFPFYATPKGQGPKFLLRFFDTTRFAAAIAVLVSGILLFVCTIATMSGTPAGIFDQDILWSVFTDMDYGGVWLARMVMAILLLGVIRTPFVPPESSHREAAAAVLSAILLVTLTAVGHAQADDGIASSIHWGANGVHLLAAGAWLGGLLPLGFALTTEISAVETSHEKTHGVDIEDILLRFSGMGYGAVSLLVASGLVNSWFLVGSLSRLVGTHYGQLLLVKLGFFGATLTLAVLNRFWLLPSLLQTRESEARILWLKRLRRHVIGEQILGFVILFIVSLLGTMQPAIEALD
ncbi:copper homeostasis membrane protein CopD [Beijerinckia indica]|uniref:Copper resistance D domain protein n=1 Tax=Beijerinckia indica subsp. indica (strain ATCC 9039 / DSM 1715 / NCIMB 8712) TaxID=395963 RepID=B2IFD1_BEII9|nr:copper homeostasis membrane protein CopD [Beijerinckia indica]ACB97031.1 copper resistance D domain protein [Beijerinckia indica subsp. indica ATCC 9039]